MPSRASPSRKPSTSYHHGDLREALIEAAFEEVEKNRVETISLAAVARNLGVSQAAPYRHFKTREDLLEAVATKGFGLLHTWLKGKLKRASSTSSLMKIASAYVAFGLERRGVYHLMYASSLLHDATATSEIYRAADQSFDLVLSEIDATLPELARRRVALSFWTSLHGVVMLAERGILPPKIRQISISDLVSDIVSETEHRITRQGLRRSAGK